MYTIVTASCLELHNEQSSCQLFGRTEENHLSHDVLSSTPTKLFYLLQSEAQHLLVLPSCSSPLEDLDGVDTYAHTATRRPLLHFAFEGEHSMMLVCISNAICSSSWQVLCIGTVVLKVQAEQYAGISHHYANKHTCACHIETLMHSPAYALWTVRIV